MNKMIAALGLLFFTVLAVFSKPFNSDEAWNFLNINDFIVNKDYLDVVQQTINYQFKLYYKAWSSITSSPITNYAIFRSVSLIFILSALFYIYKFAKEYFDDERMGFIAALLYLFFATSATSTGIILRGEFVYSPIAAMLFSGLYLSFVCVSAKSKVYALVPVLLTPIAFSSHPVGLVLYFVVLLFILMYKDINIIKKVQLSCIYSVYYGAVFYFIAIYPHTFSEIMAGIKSLSGTRFKFWQEYYRYISLLSLGKEQVLFVATSIAGLFLYFAKNGKEKYKKILWDRYLCIVFLSVLLFFFGITSKGMCYFSVLYFFFVFGFLNLIKIFSINDKGLNFTILFCVLILVTSLWTSIFTNEDFMRLMHIPNYRVARISNVEKIIANNKVIAPSSFYLLATNNAAEFFPLERCSVYGKTFENSRDFNFLIYPIKLSQDNIKKRLNLSRLKFMQAFTYQGEDFILYKTK